MLLNDKMVDSPLEQNHTFAERIEEPIFSMEIQPLIVPTNRTLPNIFKIVIGSNPTNTKS